MSKNIFGRSLKFVFRGIVIQTFLNKKKKKRIKQEEGRANLNVCICIKQEEECANPNVCICILYF